MKKLKMPFVMIDRFLEEVDCCSVIVNHRSGGYAATKHLLELGHQNIACVAGPLALEDSQHRLKGYKEALEEYGIAYDPDLIYEGNYDRESGKEAVEYILGLSKKVTAIFSFNDMSAYGVYNRLKKHNYYIPRDMSLVGYDDIFFSEILDVPLTSVSQPVYDMGVEAVQQIISEIGSGVNSRKCITFQPKLTVRESTQRLKENIR